jgi:ABC-2 type transport system ATP-binding protein
MTEVLEVVGAHKHFGATRALDGAELSLDRGECLGLLGPNGAGKTTLVRSITGRVRLDEGQVTLLGTALGGPDGKADETRRRLGVVPQEVAVYPLLTARENLEIFAALHGVASPQVKDRVAWALEWTGLADRADEPTKRFSGGMKRRLNIACSTSRAGSCTDRRSSCSTSRPWASIRRAASGSGRCSASCSPTARHCC